MTKKSRPYKSENAMRFYEYAGARPGRANNLGKWETLHDDPCYRAAKRFAAEYDGEVDPDRQAGPVRTLADMSEDEIKALENQYGCKVRRPTKEGV